MTAITPGPLPSKHIFLHQVGKQPLGSKVRFLGCVASYDILTGILVLEHSFPVDEPQISRVSTDIRLILETTKSDDLQPGAWLNIIGYVCRPPPRMKRAQSASRILDRINQSVVQAVLLWNARSVCVGDYEKILLQQQDQAR